MLIPKMVLGWYNTSPSPLVKKIILSFITHLFFFHKNDVHHCNKISVLQNTGVILSGVIFQSGNSFDFIKKKQKKTGLLKYVSQHSDLLSGHTRPNQHFY